MGEEPCKPGLLLQVSYYITTDSWYKVYDEKLKEGDAALMDSSCSYALRINKVQEDIHHMQPSLPHLDKLEPGENKNNPYT